MHKKIRITVKEKVTQMWAKSSWMVVLRHDFIVDSVNLTQLDTAWAKCFGIYFGTRLDRHMSLFIFIETFPCVNFQTNNSVLSKKMKNTKHTSVCRSYYMQTICVKGYRIVNFVIRVQSLNSVYKRKKERKIVFFSPVV